MNRDVNSIPLRQGETSEGELGGEAGDYGGAPRGGDDARRGVVDDEIVFDVDVDAVDRGDIDVDGREGVALVERSPVVVARVDGGEIGGARGVGHSPPSGPLASYKGPCAPPLRRPGPLGSR